MTTPVRTVRVPGTDQDLVLDQWLPYPIFSTFEIGITGTAPTTVSDPIVITIFNYIQSGKVSHTSSLPARTALATDTNVTKKRGMNFNEEFFLYAVTYEPFGMTDSGSTSTSVGAIPLKAPAPAVEARNLSFLSRDLLFELIVGAGQRFKPAVRCPWSYLRQSIGSPAWGPGDAPTATDAISIGTGGTPSPTNQRRLEYPVRIAPQQVAYAQVTAPQGPIHGLTQSLRVRVYLDGIKRRPVVSG